MGKFGPWPGVPTGDGGAPAEWFLARLARARTLIPAANFDSIIGHDFGQTVDVELADPVGTADASPVSGRPAGVIRVTVGDPVIALSSGRLQLVGAPSHVAQLNSNSFSWYAASLAKCVGLSDLGDNSTDMIGLFSDADNRVMLGVRGTVSGGSTTNWVASSVSGGSESNRLGPALDVENAIWHLFEMWSDGPADTVSFAIDGAPFAGTFETEDLTNASASLGMVVERVAAGIDVADVLYDKVCVIVASTAPGST